jgi:multidrug resistance protein, MATE family
MKKPEKRPSPFLRFRRGPAFGRELRATLYLALPLMLGELSSMLMGVAGTMMTGRLGETALAAAGISGVVFVFSMLLVWGGVRILPTPVAEAHELRDGARVKTLLLAGGVLALFFTVACMALLQAGIALFDQLGQDPEVAALAIEYLRIILWSMPMLVIFAIFVNFLDAFEYVKITMYLSIFGMVLDITLNYLLIFGHFGFPRLGFKAIALNTGITHTVLNLGLLWFLWRKKELAYLWAAQADRREVLRQSGRFIRHGLPSALQIMVEFAAFGAGTVLIGRIGKTEQAAHQIAINLISITYVTVMGVSTAGMIRVGQAMAYRNRARVWLAGTATLCLAIGLMLVPMVLFLGIPHQIAALYSRETAVVSIATGLVFCAGLFQVADAAQATGLSLLRSLHDILTPSFISLVAFWLVGLPLGYWLAFYRQWHAQGIWAGYLVALSIQALWFVGRFYGRVKKYNWQTDK